MKDLLPLLASYLASKTSKTAGVNVFYNEMPDKSDECICIYERPTEIGVLPQINAQVHKITVAIRSTSNTLASDLAYNCYKWLLSGTSDEDTGFIALSDVTTVYVWLSGPPTWDKADTQNRKYYTFNATITTTR